MIRSRAKLAYETASEADLPDGLSELARRIEAAEHKRGAARIGSPEQELEVVAPAASRFRFARAFGRNSRTRLFPWPPIWPWRNCSSNITPACSARWMNPTRPLSPACAYRRRALGVRWPGAEPLKALEQRLDPDRPAEAALMLAIRRAGHGAFYAPYRADEVPWHAAVAATYAHATAPLRRLADRYVVEAALALANGRDLPRQVEDAFPELPSVMERADGLSGRVEAAVLNLAEAVMLGGRKGELFDALVIETSKIGLPSIGRAAHSGAAEREWRKARRTSAPAPAARPRRSVKQKGGVQPRRSSATPALLAGARCRPYRRAMRKALD